MDTDLAIYRNNLLRDFPETLVRVAEIDKEAGLHYDVAGNLPGRVDEYNDTCCPQCAKILVRRQDYVLGKYRITPHGTCTNVERVPSRVH